MFLVVFNLFVSFRPVWGFLWLLKLRRENDSLKKEIENVLERYNKEKQESSKK